MLLELKNISKHYGNQGSSGQRLILEDISLTINTGDNIAIVGPSGSGKSTLLNIMGTLDSPSSGMVLLNGFEINTFDEKTLAEVRNRHIGFVFQKHYLLPQLNILENVLVPVIPIRDKSKQKAAPQRAKDLLVSIGLGDNMHRLPSQLSVGECQRAAMVRALMNEPEILLADEPTGSLDHDSALQLGDLLLNIKNDYKVAIVVVTHSTELADRMSHIYKLINGKLVNEKQ
jgi:ABC-type lipoprotein export system ATPase subunit